MWGGFPADPFYASSSYRGYDLELRFALEFGLMISLRSCHPM